MEFGRWMSLFATVSSNCSDPPSLLRLNCNYDNDFGWVAWLVKNSDWQRLNDLVGSKYVDIFWEIRARIITTLPDLTYFLSILTRYLSLINNGFTNCTAAEVTTDALNHTPLFLHVIIMHLFL